MLYVLQVLPPDSVRAASWSEHARVGRGADEVAFRRLLVCKQRSKGHTKTVQGDWDMLLPTQCISS